MSVHPSNYVFVEEMSQILEQYLAGQGSWKDFVEV